MSNAPGARVEADLCLSMNRWGGSPLLMILDASFTSVGLGYFHSVVPAVQRFRTWGRCSSLRDLQDADLDSLRIFWKNQRSWEVARGAASYLVRLQEDRSLAEERDALACWAHESRPDRWREDPIGMVKGVGISTFQYLRMMGGVDTAMPDKIVRRVVERALREAGWEMNIDGDLALIDAVRHIGKASGYRSADICWMCWLIQ
jgi:hypothetical protein